VLLKSNACAFFPPKDDSSVKKVWVSEDPVLVDTRTRVLDALLAHQVKVKMACGGKGLCATCHCYIDAGAEQLTAKTPREEIALTMLVNRKANSRLACQAKVVGEGVRVSLPSGRYIENTQELDSLVGRRAESAILHPVTGVVLVEEGKIITRTRIGELATVNVDVAEMKARSATLVTQ
jgi:ferredoxin